MVRKKQTILLENGLHAQVWQENGVFVSQCVEIDVASEGETLNEAIKAINEATDLYLDEGGRKLKVSPLCYA